MPSVSNGMNEVCAPALLALSGPATPSIAPRPEHRAVAGQDAEHRADAGRAHHRAEAAPQVLARGQQAPELRDRDVARLGVLEVPQDLRDAEHPHREHGEVDPVGQLGDPEGEPLLAGLEVGADRGKEQAEHDHDHRLQHRAAREHHREPQAENHQAEVLGRTEEERQPRERRADRRDDERRHAAGEE
jgi:hypothetical protein